MISAISRNMPKILFSNRIFGMNSAISRNMPRKNRAIAQNLSENRFLNRIYQKIDFLIYKKIDFKIDFNIDFKIDLKIFKKVG